MAAKNNNYSAPKPAYRKLQGYAFDPTLSLQMDTADINKIIYKIDWEELEVGPVGEYIEVIDYDPTLKKFYKQVDLNDPYLLAESGLEPSEGNPLFHQQMVYAVAMVTIKNFEKALGRKVLWASRKLADKLKYDEYVQRLRIYPHALRDANAYYSPPKKALLFGYFSAVNANKSYMMPDTLTFTCLSHDIIAHEVTHAILDGIYPMYNKSTNPDVLAFHEAFADIIALFQHFTFPEVLKHQISATKGDLENQNLLGKLAQGFGSAIGNYGSLRDFIGEQDKKTKQWKLREPKTDDYEKNIEPHKRGSVLVSAIFEAFINIYKRKVADLLRIATEGTGVLPEGQLHPDLVNRLANEASKSAEHVLGMCIRALDYCPPVDITFGDYLRAIITADIDLIKEDTLYYRLAFIEAFRKRGIYPRGVKTLSVENLQHHYEPNFDSSTDELFRIITDFLREYRDKVSFEENRERIFDISKEYMGGSREKDIMGLHERFYRKFNGSKAFELLTGLVFRNDWKNFGIKTSKAHDRELGGPSFQVNNLRLVSRVGPRGNQINQIVFSIVQHCSISINDEGEIFAIRENTNIEGIDNKMEFYGGCTMIFDLNTLKLRYCISKPILDLKSLNNEERSFDKDRIINQIEYLDEVRNSLTEYSSYFFSADSIEPFSIIHKH